MRRPGSVVACIIAVLAVLAPPALAQAPAPKVTITGLVDNVANWNDNVNMPHGDFDITRDDDDEFYGRTRGRFDFIGEVGRAKAVLGFEFDLIYGGSLRSGPVGGVTGAAVDNPSGRPDGTSGGFDADNDVRNALELKWMYVEAPLPWLPGRSLIRLGGQPFTVSLKPFSFASSDFAGVHLDLDFGTVRAGVTYAQFEEGLTGAPQFADDDWGVIGFLSLTPFKGLEVRPIVSFQEIRGATSNNVRVPFAGLANSSTVFGAGAGAAEENRWTIGADARWQFGPFSILPTVFYQWGERELISGGTLREADLQSWFVDIQAGWRLGPLLLEVRGVATSGNDAGDDLTDEINVFSMFQTGNAYWIGWGEALGIGNIDYLTSLYGFSNGLALPAQASYDRYGRLMFSVRATYALTPAVSVYGIVTPMWTTEKVDTDATATTSGLVGGDGRGDDRYLGTDLTAGITYRFAPGLTFDAVYGILIAGDGLGLQGRDPENAQVASARIRYVF